ncbi:MAG: NAD-dependent deacylase [Chthoniobacter sp.]|nr:NAD-dependent deacylase [Chthoniobacter sp.]
MSPTNVVILTGAGISAESGIPTFRGSDGLWEGHRVEDVASPEGFAANPTLVHQFYNLRRAALKAVEPNAAHQALARLQKTWGNRVTLVTQNVDDLHERAGSTEVLHMHGELLAALCAGCEHRFKSRTDLKQTMPCPACGAHGSLRPDIVWFGEMPYCMDDIHHALTQAKIFVSIGTSGNVYPAAGLVRMAALCGATTIEINLEPSVNTSEFDQRFIGPASVEVPRWVEQLVRGTADPLPQA